MSRKLPIIVPLYIMFTVCVYEWAWSVVLYRPDVFMALPNTATCATYMHTVSSLPSPITPSMPASLGPLEQRELCSLMSFKCVEKGGAWMPDNISQQVPVVTGLSRHTPLRP